MSDWRRSAAMLAMLGTLIGLPACRSAQDRYGGWKFEDETFRNIAPLDVRSAETAPPKSPDGPRASTHTQPGSMTSRREVNRSPSSP